MNKRIILICASFLMLFTAHSNAQKEISTKNDYVVLTRKIPQLKPILISAEELKKEDGKQFGNFEIIICGKTVQDIPDNDAILDFIERANRSGAAIKACGFSLQKFGVDPKKLPSEIEVVENGILYNLQLQKKGYFSIEL
jgi:intracellular sulfur oxidation DsrE/DsrF family protein